MYLNKKKNLKKNSKNISEVMEKRNKIKKTDTVEWATKVCVASKNRIRYKQLFSSISILHLTIKYKFSWNFTLSHNINQT